MSRGGELGHPQPETVMDMIIRKFNYVRSVLAATHRAERGIGRMLKHSPGFQV